MYLPVSVLRESKGHFPCCEAHLRYLPYELGAHLVDWVAPLKKSKTIGLTVDAPFCTKGCWGD